MTTNTSTARVAHSKPEKPAEAVLVTWRVVAGMLAVSRATFDRMRAAGRILQPIRLSSTCHRWRLQEVRDWVAAGCPPAKEWEARAARR